MLASLRAVDFAALETLILVHRLKSFTAAAEALNMKQSSVSYTIERLRNAFEDPLFVRQGNQMLATHRCIDIVGAAERSIGEIELAAEPVAFDPASIDASITISVTYLARSVLLPRLVKELRTEAPGLSLELVAGFTDAGHQLLSGRADMALSPVEITASGIEGRFLFEDPYICLMDAENALAKEEMTRTGFASASHLIIHYGQKWRPPFLDALENEGFKIKPAMSTANPEDVGLLVPGTDLIVTMPSRIVSQFTAQFSQRPCPVAAAAQLNFYWPKKHDSSPLHVWVRKKILSIAETLENDAG